MEKKKLFVLLLDLGLTILAFAAGPMTEWMLRIIPGCPVAGLGLQCPACGGTRCVRYFFSWNFADAFQANPFFFLLILYLAAALVLLNIGVMLKVQWAQRLARTMTCWQAVIATAILFAIFGVVRNLW